MESRRSNEKLTALERNYLIEQTGYTKLKVSKYIGLLRSRNKRARSSVKATQAAEKKPKV